MLKMVCASCSLSNPSADIKEISKPILDATVTFDIDDTFHSSQQRAIPTCSHPLRCYRRYLDDYPKFRPIIEAPVAQVDKQDADCLGNCFLPLGVFPPWQNCQ